MQWFIIPFFWSSRVKKFIHFYLFIYLFIHLSVFFSSNPNMVESGDSSRERSSSLVDLMANSTHRVSWRKEGEKKDRRERNGEVRVGGLGGGVGVRENMRAFHQKSILLPSVLPSSLLPSNWTLGWAESGRARRRKWDRERVKERKGRGVTFGLAYPDLIQPKSPLMFL